MERVARIRKKLINGWSLYVDRNQVIVFRVRPVVLTLGIGPTANRDADNLRHWIRFSVVFDRDRRLSPEMHRRKAGEMARRLKRLRRLAEGVAKHGMSGFCFDPAAPAERILAYKQLAYSIELIPDFHDDDYRVVHIIGSHDSLYRWDYSGDSAEKEVKRMRQRLESLFKRYPTVNMSPQ